MIARKDLALFLSKKKKMSYADAYDIVNILICLISNKLSESQPVSLRGIGTFLIKKRKAGVGRNPKKPKESHIFPEKKTVKFKASKSLIDSLNSE